MFYRVIAFINFVIEDEANDFVHDCELALTKSVTINPGTLKAEASRYELHECYHDESPSIPCEEVLISSTPLT